MSKDLEPPRMRRSRRRADLTALGVKAFNDIAKGRSMRAIELTFPYSRATLYRALALAKAAYAEQATHNLLADEEPNPATHWLLI